MSRGERGRGVLLPAVSVLLGVAPGSADILDRLGCGHGRVDHLRYKPGLSVVARADGGSARWVAGFGPAAREKADKLRLKGAALGYGLRETPVPGAPGHVLMSGPLGLDNRLRGPLRAEGLLDHRGEPAGTVLNYNPWRRLVLASVETGERGRVSKTTAGPPGDLPALLAGLAGEGVPVLVPRPGRDARTLHYPRYGSEDLASAWERAAAGGNGTPGAARAGRILAALHASGARPGRAVEPWRPLLGVAAAVADVLPGAAGLARRTAVELLDATEPAGRGDAAEAPLHGDFSADQLLVGPDGLRLIDLDRSARGPAGWDLGCFAATELLAGRHGGAEELLDAYFAARPASGRVDVGPWTGIHLMARALEPFRDAAPGWEDLVLARLRLAGAALREGTRAGLRHRVAATGAGGGP
ncbi:MAG: hypothetical protein ABWX68_06265 [Arthrobacter sp.]|uniref:hypothetical protein n=1 Tax=Arthrobacter sp. TaxID=1667 RepID=UPI003483288A